MLDLFLAMFLIAFICTALVVGIFAARFGEDLRRSMGFAYIAAGVIGIFILLWLARILPMDAPAQLSFGPDRLFYSAFLLVTVLVGTAAGLFMVFLTTLSSD